MRYCCNSPDLNKLTSSRRELHSFGPEGRTLELALCSAAILPRVVPEVDGVADKRVGSIGGVNVPVDNGFA